MTQSSLLSLFIWLCIVLGVVIVVIIVQLANERATSSSYWSTLFRVKEHLLTWHYYTSRVSINTSQYVIDAQKLNKI